MKKLMLTLVMLISSITWAVGFDSNVPSDVQKQMKEDLQFITTIQGSGQTKFHNEIFGQVDGGVYDKFFNSRVKNVGYNDCGSANAVACVIMWYPAKMWITDNYIKFSHPQISRLMVVFHEARHTEYQNGNWSHATCPNPFLDENGKDKVSIWTGAKLAGEPACDSTYKGSYGSSTVMLKNISKFCANCSDKVKMDADIYATDQLGRIDRTDVKDAMIADFNGN